MPDEIPQSHVRAHVLRTFHNLFNEFCSWTKTPVAATTNVPPAIQVAHAPALDLLAAATSDWMASPPSLPTS